MALTAEEIDREFQKHQAQCFVCSQSGAQLCVHGLEILMRWADVLAQPKKDGEAA